ncbi:pilus assembly protein N-terminal domain-containing protein [Gilliamella sp. B14448G11]|uniref:type II and III secretion system protein family protein n=1 Tax=unclassified Gilliamella TaxID=2685620 RepID=UPI0018DB2C0C|nr:MULTISPECIES: pilus assembly protein N-terminal domain-containing protein [unclassified Gilliamella]MBI0029429.1 pilus assembly protein N-terminal domain-containing protein [Gilliamella sp. B14448G7]MBI0030872.1 pilus assembly protein N-terminal domain-containing protein [Gilliamella sp. B14384G15]MBI0036407.1 pilus assembly protein N-terminal domain-containing protein [Gilliamella sp. B14448G11]MBI0043592.1 pilus assembly protein N-terminal domain-containing protein [Gilliamella sp. B14448G
MLIRTKSITNMIKPIICLLSIGFSSLAFANIHNLQIGQSKTLVLPENVGTVFISQDSIANYEVIDGKSLIIYGRSNGRASLIVYDSENNIVINDTINVDPLLYQITNRLAQNFPNSSITIDRYDSGDANKFVYVLSGTAPDTTTKGQILALIGSSIGQNAERVRQEFDNGGGGSGNQLLTFQDYYTYSNIIDNIRVIEEYQVNVQLTFVEVSKDFTDSLGIEWQSLTLDSMISGESVTNSIGEFSLLGIRKGLNIHNIATMIRAVKNDRLAKVLAQPNLSVLSGESASFLVGGEIPIVTKNKDGDANITYKEYGIRLNISTKVNNDKRIRLFMENEVSSISGSYAFNDYNIPTLTSRKTRSTIDLSDGDSFVIAGLINENDQEQLSRLPFISDIPILGALARSSTTSRSKSEMVVFATVNLVTPKSSFDSIELPTIERTDVINSFFNIKNNLNKERNKTVPASNESEKFINDMGFIE